MPTSISTALATAEDTPLVHPHSQKQPPSTHQRHQRLVLLIVTRGRALPETVRSARALAAYGLPIVHRRLLLSQCANPIVIDEDDDSIRRPMDESIEFDLPTQTLSILPKTAAASGLQGMQENKAYRDTDDRNAQPERDEVGRTIFEYMRSWPLRMLPPSRLRTPSPLVSEHRPPVMGTLRADVRW